MVLHTRCSDSLWVLKWTCRWLNFSFRIAQRPQPTENSSQKPTHLVMGPTPPSSNVFHCLVTYYEYAPHWRSLPLFL